MVCAEQAEALFSKHHAYLWGVCYRMTGVAADAEEAVQETFVRLLERGPKDEGRDHRPWLMKVAMNLCRDRLRQRKSRPYVGPWLPSPIETEAEAPPGYEPSIDGRHTTAGRYELMESVTMAFLVALEALSEKQRAVLLLRDVFDYSVRETSEALDISLADTKTTLHRARALMARYDTQRCRPSHELSERTQTVLASMLAAMGSGDRQALSALLAEEIVCYNDGGGEFVAARVPIFGPQKVARFFINISKGQAPPIVSIRHLNGLPALITDFPSPARSAKSPPKVVTQVQLDSRGHVSVSYFVLASDKLDRIA